MKSTRSYCDLLLTFTMGLCLLFQTAANAFEPYGYKAHRAECDTDPNVIRTVVIGGLATTTDTWQQISAMFESRYPNYTVELVADGNTAVTGPVFRSGQADVLAQHSADVTTDLVADGYGLDLLPWAHNEHIIIGPWNDPAGAKGLDAVEAFKKIAAAGKQGTAMWVDLWGAGKREVAGHIAAKAGIHPGNGGWVVADGSAKVGKQLEFVASLGFAYAMIGRAPFVSGKQNTFELEMIVGSGDDLKRPFVSIRANPKKFPCTNVRGAKKLQRFLISKEVQEFLATHLVDEFGGEPPFQPLRMEAFADE